MGEIADAMLGGELCGMCGACLDCDECEKMGIPMYCSEQCARDAGMNKHQVCNH